MARKAKIETVAETTVEATGYEQTSPVITKRYDFMLVMDVRDGNPNGDPDTANAPRLDEAMQQGLITGTSLKRKIRDTITETHHGVPGMEIFISRGAASSEITSAVRAEGGQTAKKGETAERICQRFFDVRAFGAVLTTKGESASKIVGPILFHAMARSLDRVLIHRDAITRVVRADDSTKGGMGERARVGYAAYTITGTVMPTMAGGRRQATGLTEADLDIFFETLPTIFMNTGSTSRGDMSMRHIAVYEHEKRMGNAQPCRVFQGAMVKRDGEEFAPILSRRPGDEARGFEEYEFSFNPNPCHGVTLNEKYSMI